LIEFLFAATSNHTASALIFGQSQSFYAGIANTGYGTYAGVALTSGTNNVLFGNAAGQGLNTGYYNTVIGSGAGIDMTSAYSNTIIGYGAGSLLVSGSGNTFVGGAAGSSSTNTFTNNTAAFETITADEFLIENTAFTHCKTLEQKDNRLFFLKSLLL
jgi:hypothetical protein